VNSPRSLVANALRFVLRAVEGAYRPGPYFLPISGGWLPDGAPLNWWQTGMNIMPTPSRSAMVEACVSAYSQTLAMCPGAHWRANSKGGRDRVTNSSLSRVLQHPNSYQSISDFLLNATRQLYLDGNSYALCLRNDRNEITELHLMDSLLCYPQLATTGDIFYKLAGNQIIERELQGETLIVPRRDVLHIRLHVDRSRTYPYPLWGVSPLLATLSDISVSDAIGQQQLQFYMNQARPSAILSTDLVLDKDQTQQLRDRWDEQSKGINQGKTPIMTAGLKVQPWAQPAKDAQVAELLKMGEERIALAFRVPLQLLGLGAHGFRSTEALMQFWIATGLGFALNHVEESFGLTFELKGQPDEYVEFSTDALLRSQYKDRLEGLARGVQGGIYAPNEARNLEGLDDVPYGDSPRVQQQVVPLEFAGKVPAPPAPPPAAGQPAPKQPGNSNDNAPEVKAHDIQREVRGILAAANRAGRRYSA
jgi:HK97 family phage portal protein